MDKTIYSNLICPICKADQKDVTSRVNCRKHEALVCMKHCYIGCKEFKAERCGFKKE